MSTNHGARFQNIEQNQGSTLRVAYDKHQVQICYNLSGQNIFRSSVHCNAAIKLLSNTGSTQPMHNDLCKVSATSKLVYTVDLIRKRNLDVQHIVNQ